mgnify:CR=1 FL=1|tara:strand:- start:55 stop:942 length:888 start_codon:yes stop_codon:yes gene_type:complete
MDMFYTKAIKNEALNLHNSIHKSRDNYNTSIYLWLINNNKPMNNHNWIKNLPYELMRDICAFTISNKKVGQYFKITDNTLYYNKFNFTNTEWRTNKKNSNYLRKLTGIGKIIRMKHFNVTLNSRIIGFIRDYLSAGDIHPIAIYGLNTLNKKLYRVSYIDWGTTFNEYVTNDQIQLIDTSFSKPILNIKLWDYIDCQNPIDNSYYRGIVTKIHYCKYKIISINIISLIKASSPKQYLIYNNIPIYSPRISIGRIHTGFYTIYIRRLLRRSFMLSKNPLETVILSKKRSYCTFVLK